jgi:hypothetical protein
MRRAFREEDILSRACLMKNCEKGVKIFRIETWPSLNAIAGVNDRTATGVCGRDEDLGSVARPDGFQDPDRKRIRHVVGRC